MPRSRAAPEPVPPPAPDVRRLAAELMRPGHFFAGPGLVLGWEHRQREEVAWEVFQGRLLDPAHTRRRQEFESWNLYQVEAGVRSAEPLLSLKLEAGAGLLHVLRGLDSYVWEGYDAGGNVYLSRERRKWVRELVGTVVLERFPCPGELLDELTGLLFRAVVGSSRLPLASVETPLPAFSFGELLYVFRPSSLSATGPRQTYPELVRDMLGPELGWLERAKLLETFLHAVPGPEMAPAAGLFLERWAALGQTGTDLARLLRTLFNEVSLSPWTDLADKTLAFLGELERRGAFSPEQVADFLGHLLRQLGRHLTAYDLVTFHHRGANYPDALLLDTVLKAYLGRIERRPDLFSADDRPARLRRRALRQGWLLRRRYEGHPVPDAPTSPGENNRVLPGGRPRVPEEQILQPARRAHRLYADDPMPALLGPNAAAVLRRSMSDLRAPQELRELGMALFLDRPLGRGKAPAELNRTLLLSAEAFSRSVAEQRLRSLGDEPGLLPAAEVAEGLRRLGEGVIDGGLPLDEVGGTDRPGSVSLTDARRAAPDFVFLRTTPGSVRALLAHFDFTPLAQRISLDFLTGGRRVLVARGPGGPGIRIYDETGRAKVEVEELIEEGYESRAGLEYPRGGLRVVRAGDSTEGYDCTLLPNPHPRFTRA